VRAGVGEECDDLRVAPERVRPAVAEDQRQDGPGRRGGPDVHEVDPEAAERDAEAGGRASGQAGRVPGCSPRLVSSGARSRLGGRADGRSRT